SNTTFVDAVYYILTGAEPTSTVLNSKLATLPAGGNTSSATGGPYTNLAKSVTSTQAYRNHLTALAFEDYLDRPPTASELSTWNSTLSQTSLGPNGMTRDEQLIQTL